MMESIDSGLMGMSSYFNCTRLKVPGGWIVQTVVVCDSSVSVAQIPVIDPTHLWELEKKPKKVDGFV